jgi:hypothetical protein
MLVEVPERMSYKLACYFWSRGYAALLADKGGNVCP